MNGKKIKMLLAAMLCLAMLFGLSGCTLLDRIKEVLPPIGEAAEEASAEPTPTPVREESGEPAETPAAEREADSSAEPEPTESGEPAADASAEPEPTESGEPARDESAEPDRGESSEPAPGESAEPAAEEDAGPEEDGDAEPEEDEDAEPKEDEDAEPEEDEDAGPEEDGDAEPKEDEDAEPEEGEDAEPEEDEDAEPEEGEDAEPEEDEDAESEEDEDAEPEEGEDAEPEEDEDAEPEEDEDAEPEEDGDAESEEPEESAEPEEGESAEPEEGESAEPEEGESAEPMLGESAEPAEEASYEADADGVPEAVKAYIVVKGFEWGPGVNKVVLELDETVDGVDADQTIFVYTSHWEREVTDVYLSDRMGYAVEGVSRYVTFELATSYDCGGSPFEYDPMGTQHNYWAEEYLVIILVTVEKGGEAFHLNYEDNCIGNHFSPDVVAFNKQGKFSGEYFNALRNTNETLTMNYAVYEPVSIAGGERNPLVIWLHGRGEGGDDIEVTLLANEVSALTETEIQSHFTSGDETGAYVLVPQVPTYWRDAGDGVEHVGDMPSRYQEMLMDLINTYIEENTDVDPGRIYLIGASNGGYMVLEMIEHYPDTFAAAVPVSPGLAYSVYAREYNGSYRTVFGQEVKTGDAYLTDEKIELLKQTPIWIVGAATDTVTPVLEYSVPLYHALVSAGAENCWCTMYQDVIGQESASTRYLGHWAWIYLLNDQVRCVQDPVQIAESDENTFYYGFEPDQNGGELWVPDGYGGVYGNLFDWLNDQTV